MLRALPLIAARPYIAYVDEGNFLHPAFRLVQKGGWDPASYVYPQFPIVAVVLAARALDPLYRSLRGRSLRDRIPERSEIYDELEPFALLLIARCLSLALGLGIIALTGLLAMRLAGPRAGAAAALLSAVVPSLVLRGSTATVDPYATIFVLACLYFTDLPRTCPRAGVASFLAGATAGAAFASKYPAVLVLVAFAVTTLSRRAGWGEKVRRLCLAGLGLPVGAVLAMPALLQHPARVFGAIALQSTLYTQFVSVPLWKQAFLRAEWDIPYEKAEMGFVFVGLSVWGLILGLRDPKITATIAGWCAFAASGLVLYGTRSFQPFRNLMPLVPLACVAAVLVFVRIREQARRPLAVDALALAWVLLAFAVPLAAYARNRYRLEDSRTQAINWLMTRVRPEDEVLFVHELSFLRQEVERLPAKPTVHWWDRALSGIVATRPRFVVGGVLQRGDGLVDLAVLPAIGSEYALRFRVGSNPTPQNSWWHGNHQIVYVLEQAPLPGRSGLCYLPAPTLRR